MARRIQTRPSPTSAARRAPSLPARRVCILAVIAATALMLAAEAVAAPRALPFPDASRIASPGAVADAEVFSLKRSALQGDDIWGGVHTTSRGESVTVYASTQYPQDPARTQAWAEYLSSLAHGTELATVNVYIAPLSQVQTVCGQGALACYSSLQHAIFTPGEAPEPDLTAEAVLAHEYGHHVAASRINTPWPAVDWGTKRWATHIGICERASRGELVPGDEGDDYSLNPGEGFAESYRVLNQQRLGATLSPWSIVDQLFNPDATALALLAQDVEQPWTAPTTLAVSGRVTARVPRSTKTISTPLDGTLKVTVRAPAKSRVTLQLIDPADGEVVARTTATAPRAATVQTTVCGERTLQARVTATRGSGTYRLAISRP